MTPDEQRAEERASDDGGVSPLRYLSGGLEFAVTCAAGALAGRWLDARFGTDPWLTALLLIVAFATATWLLLRALTRAAGPGTDRDRSDSR